MYHLAKTRSPKLCWREGCVWDRKCCSCCSQSFLLIFSFHFGICTGLRELLDRNMWKLILGGYVRHIHTLISTILDLYVVTVYGYKIMHTCIMNLYFVCCGLWSHFMLISWMSVMNVSQEYGFGVGRVELGWPTCWSIPIYASWLLAIIIGF